MGRGAGRHRGWGRAAALAMALAAAASPSAAEYIRDVVYVPLRSGGSLSHRIIDNLKSGDQVEVIGGDRDGYVQVRTAAGETGWLEAQYLVDRPIAAQRLRQMAAEHQRLRDERDALQRQLDEATAAQSKAEAAATALRESEGRLKGELGEIRALSADSLRLNEEHVALVAEHSRLTAEATTLKARNAKLARRLERDDFMNGAYAVGMGVVLAVVVPYVWPRRRRRSEWA